MELKFNTLLSVFIRLFVFLALSSCTIDIIKPAPEYKGVDSRIQVFVNEYKSLAKDHGITFKNDVSIGFTKISYSKVIGFCTFGYKWREIDLDLDYWTHSNNNTRLALIFHELTHCYCGRDHDYGNGTMYPEAPELTKIFASVRNGSNGYYEDDDCPTSIMYPIVLDNRCLLAHYNDYISEMFSRCQEF